MVRRETVDDIEVYLGEADDGSGDEAVLYLSGWRDFGVYHDRVPALVETFEDEGVDVLAAPYRGVLGQPGEYTVVSMLDDAAEFAGLLADRRSPDRITAVGNCLGGLAALGAAAETDLIDRVVTMNSLWGLRNDDWWTSDEEYGKRTARWRYVEGGAEGPLGTAFRGLTESYYKEEVCRCPDRLALDERTDAVRDRPILMMVSHEDDKIDPLHTLSMYRHVRNAQADIDVEREAELRVLPRVDESHTMLLDDHGLQRDVADWIRSAP